VLYDAMLVDDNGASLLYSPVYNFQQGDLRAVHEMLSNPLTLVGLGDGGAHSATVCDTAFTTFNLTHWARDRVAGPAIPLERMVHLMSGAQANHFGLKDRGRIAVGWRADLNVIDHQRLTLQAPRTVRDLPGGEQRLLQKAEGYIASVLDGVRTVSNDELTGAKPGKVLRAA
jgi:N-acyl-D-aspartate/D-glutamate deacylase